MPNWKKVIVSGSDAALNSLIVANGATITGSLNITGSIQTPNWIDFKTGSDQPQAIGRLGWDDGNGTLNLGLKGGNVNLQLGQEMLARVYNADSVPLTDGMIVYISGSQGNRIAVKRAAATSDTLSANTLGMVTETISVGAEGFITTQGTVNGLNTAALTAGAMLFLSSSAGQYTTVRPTAPIHTVIIGYVERSHATVGSIYVKIDNGYELGELHDIVDNTTTSSYGDLLVKSGSVWTNSKQLTGSYSITGSLTATSQLIIGSPITASTEATLILGPPPGAGAGEGGQIIMQAPGGTYSSASMWDNYQNQTRLLRGSNASSDAVVASWNMHTKQMQLPAYNSTTAFTGTVAGILAFDSSGNILTTTASAGGGGGSGTVNSGTAGFLTYYPSTGTTVDDTSGVYWDSANSKLLVTGSITATANGAMYFRGGDDAEFWDINVANTVGIYGQQDATVGSIKLGSGGGVISGKSSNIGIGTTNPSYKLDVAGDIHVQSSGTSGTIYFGNDAQNYLGYYNTDSYHRSNGAHYFEGSGFYKGIWNADGNLGVGTTSVSGNTTNRVVSIVGADSANLVLTETGGASAAFTSYANEAYIGTATNHPFYLYTSGSERMRIGTNGSMKFNAYGSGTFTGTVAYNLAVDSSGNIIETAGGVVDGSGTANYVTKWQDSNTVTNSVMYDDGTNIGIGTTSPSAKLHVIGGGNVAIFGSAGSSLDNFIKFQGSSNAFDVGTTSAGYWGIADSGVAYRFVVTQAGNVGIGVTNPNTTLEVNKTVSFSSIDTYAQLVVKTTSGANGKLLNIGVDESAGLSFIQSLNRGTDSMPLILQRYSGNVGIGITNPSEKLSVNGNIALPKSGETFIYNDQSSSDSVSIGGASYLSFKTYSGTWNEIIRITSSGNVGIGTTNPAYKLSVVGKIALNSGAGNDIFIGDNAGLSDDATNNANLAIGINASQNNVSGSQNVAIGNNSLQFNVAGNNTAVGSNASRYNTLGDNNTSFGSYAMWSTIDGRNNTGIGAAALLFNTSGSSNVAVGSSALRLNTSGSGNVGIGLSALNPNTIGNDNIAIGRNAGRYYGSSGTNALTNTSASIFIGDTSRANNLNETNQIVIGTAALGLGSNSVVLGNDNITTTALKGNVGIGTTSPSTKLHVEAGTVFVKSNVNNGSAILTIRSSDDYGYTFARSNTTGFLEFDGNQTGAIGYIFKNGNVGIGTTNPTQPLHIAGNLRVTGAIYDSNNSAGSSGEILTSTGTGIDWVSLSSISGVDGTGTANYVPKWTDADTIGNSAIYDNSGNIGIGTTNPGAKLEVVGTFRATTKSFLIDHPTKESKKLQYGVLEGPEHSVYVRGKLTGTRRIELPDYWHALVDEDSITVNLTAIGRGQQLWVEEITDTYIMVGSDSGIVNCFYTVFAERKDVDKLITEFDKE